MESSPKLLSFLLAFLLLAACNGTTQAVPTAELPTAKVWQVTQTFTATLPLPTGTFTATFIQTTTSMPTSTPVPCDPAVGYCLEPGHFLLDRPIALPGTNKIDWGYPYGSTEYKTREPHHGDEFVNASGTPVLAAAEGTVVVAGTDSQQNNAVYTNTYGNLVVLEHHLPGIGPVLYTLYGHLSMVEVQVGQSIHAGDEVGLVGSSGEAIGSHLHFEVREGRNNYDSNRNPVLWLKPLDSKSGTLAGRLEDKHGNPIYTDAINVQYFPDPNGIQAAAWPVETYAPEKHPVQEDDTFRENFVLGDLRPGQYRISLMWGGKLIDRWVNIQAGMLTLFVLRTDG